MKRSAFATKSGCIVVSLPDEPGEAPYIEILAAGQYIYLPPGDLEALSQAVALAQAQEEALQHD